MLRTGLDAYLRAPSEGKERILHPCRIITAAVGGCTAELRAGGLVPKPGQDLLLYYDAQNKFMQQAVRVEMVLDQASPAPAAAEPEPQGAAAAAKGADRRTNERVVLDDGASAGPVLHIGLQLVGQPVSAESRNCFRVITLFAKITATLAGEPNCTVKDVSATGFSVLSSVKHASGAVLSLSLEHEGKRYSGSARVQSVVEVGAAKYRYGLLCLSGRGVEGNLEKGLAQVSASVQRSQLRRLSGT